MTGRKLLGTAIALACVTAPAFAAAGTGANFDFKKDLQLRVQDPEVLQLQQFLNAEGYIVAAAGAGSAGHETDYFGTRTLEAVKEFQAAFGLPATGFFGPMSRTAALIVGLMHELQDLKSQLLQASQGTAQSTSSPAVPIGPVWVPTNYTPGFGGGAPSASANTSGSGGSGGGGSPSYRADNLPEIGVNISAMEGGSTLPGTIGTDYFRPSTSDLDYLVARGITVARLPIKWERLQPTLGGALDSTYLSQIEGIVDDAHARGIGIVLDIHNFGAYNGHALGSTELPVSDFVDLWQRLATVFVNYPGIDAYDIMNEPQGFPSASVWPTAAQDAVDAIRAIDTDTPIFVEGDCWSASKDWLTCNANLNITDPSNELVYSAHAYGDRDNSGTHFTWADEAAQGVTTDTIANRIQPFESWIESHGYRGNIGETGVGNDDANWDIELDTGISYATSHDISVYYWAYGPFMGSYAQNVYPWDGTQQKQMAVLTKYTGATQPTTYYIYGPHGGTAGQASNDFMVDYRGYLSKSVTITPTDGGAGGSFSPASITLPAGFNAAATFTYTQNAQKQVTISTINTAGWTDPTGIAYSTGDPINLLSSSDLSGWSTSNSAIQADWTTDADGDKVAARLTDNSASNYHYFASPTVTVAADQDAEVVIDFRNESRRYVRVTWTPVSDYGDGIGVVVDTTNGTLSGAGAFGTGSYTRSAIEDLGNGWYRVHLVGKMNTTSTKGTVRLWLASGPSTFSYVGAGNAIIAANANLYQPASVPDTTAPTVAITSPTDGATASSTVTVAATATDNNRVAGVTFYDNGVTIGTEDTTSPYSTLWSTTATTSGSHVLTAVARDSWGNSATSSAVTVTVDNSAATVSTTSVSLSSGWISSNASITPNFTSSPEGTQTAARLADNTANSTHDLYSSFTTIQPGNQYTVVAYLKNESRQYVQMRWLSTGSHGAHVDVDTVACTVANGAAEGTGTYVSSSASSAGNGWCRVVLTGKLAPSGTSGTVAFRLENTLGGTTYAGNGAALYLADLSITGIF